MQCADGSTLGNLFPLVHELTGLVGADDVASPPDAAPREALVGTVEFVRKLGSRSERDLLGAAIRDHLRHQQIMRAC